MSRVIYELLTDCVHQLDQVRQQLEKTAELLLDVRNRDSGVGGDWRDDVGGDA